MALSRTAVEIGAVGAVAEFLVFNHFMPPVCDVRMQQPYDKNLEKSERTGLLAGLIVAGLFTALSPGKMETFIMTGGTLAVMDFAYKHANAVHPAYGTMMKNDMGADQSLYAVPAMENDPGTYEDQSA